MEKKVMKKMNTTTNSPSRSTNQRSGLRRHAALAAGVALASGALAQPGFLFTLIPDDAVPSMTFSSAGMDMRDGVVAADGNVSPGVYLFDARTGQQLRKIPVPSASFGPVAVGGGFVATSDPRADANGVFDSGTILVFDADTGQQVHTLTLGDAQPLDLFGTAMDIQGSTMIATAISADSFFFPSNRKSGAAFIFDLSTGAQVATLVPSDSAPGDRFGISVAIDGETAILGAEPIADGLEPAAYIFRESAPGSWVEVAKLTAPDVADFDRFGSAVAIDGETIVVGRSSDDQLGTDAGAAFIYREVTPGDWQLVTKLTASDAAQVDLFGASVAVRDGLVVVGATEASVGGMGAAGKAYVFEEMPDGSWVETAILTQDEPNELARFGRHVALDGDALAVAVPADDNAGDRSGAVYVFETGGAPACPADLDGNGALDANDFFAYLDLFASSDPAADLTGEGLVDADDFFEYLTLFAAGCP